MYHHCNGLISGRSLILFFIANQFANAQINLGTFQLGPAPNGGWNLGFNQGANLLGFGGDRGFQLNGGKDTFGIQGNQGLLVGGERVGVDSGLGVNPGGNLGLGSMLSFGNQPSSQPGGQLATFLQRIGAFFANPLGGSGVPRPDPIPPTHLPTLGLAVPPAPQIPPVQGPGPEGPNEHELDLEDRFEDNNILFSTLTPRILGNSDEEIIEQFEAEQQTTRGKFAGAGSLILVLFFHNLSLTNRRKGSLAQFTKTKQGENRERRSDHGPDHEAYREWWRCQRYHDMNKRMNK